MSLLRALPACSLSSAPQEGVLRGKEKLKIHEPQRFDSQKRKCNKQRTWENIQPHLVIKEIQRKTMSCFLKAYQISKKIYLK